MQTFEEEGRRVLKRQRLCAEQVHRHLDLLLTEVETARSQLVARQDEYRRKRQAWSSRTPSSPPTTARTTASTSSQQTTEATEASAGDDCDSARAAGEERDLSASMPDAQARDMEMEEILHEFIQRVKSLNLEKGVAEEFKSLHATLGKYGKQIDKLFPNDITKICRTAEPDHQAVCQLIAEYLYHNGQIAAADALCKEATLDLSSNYRECFVELHGIMDALKEKQMAPALEWARQHRDELLKLHIDIEFELIQLQYLDLVESCTDVMEAVKFANDELSSFHASHPKDIGRLLSCVLYKGRFEDSPYKDLFDPNRWEHIREAVAQACCRLRRVPHRAYLDTCLSAGSVALPAMKKLVAVMENKVSEWGSLEELPVELPVASEHRFHTVFACPVSKEESTPANPPMLLKCGHVICKSCVRKISLNMTRRFKCPTCPVEQTESETRELFF